MISITTAHRLTIYEQTFSMPPNNLQLHCKECDKAFNTEQDLKLHKNIKHNQAAIKPQNINSSDSSDDDESLKRYKEKFAKKKPESRV